MAETPSEVEFNSESVEITIPHSISKSQELAEPQGTSDDLWNKLKAVAPKQALGWIPVYRRKNSRWESFRNWNLEEPTINEFKLVWETFLSKQQDWVNVKREPSGAITLSANPSWGASPRESTKGYGRDKLISLAIKAAELLREQGEEPQITINKGPIEDIFKVYMALKKKGIDVTLSDKMAVKLREIVNKGGDPALNDPLDDTGRGMDRVRTAHKMLTEMSTLSEGPSDSSLDPKSSVDSKFGDKLGAVKRKLQKINVPSITEPAGEPIIPQAKTFGGKHDGTTINNSKDSLIAPDPTNGKRNKPS